MFVLALVLKANVGKTHLVKRSPKSQHRNRWRKSENMANFKHLTIKLKQPNSVRLQNKESVIFNLILYTLPQWSIKSFGIRSRVVRPVVTDVSENCGCFISWLKYSYKNEVLIQRQSDASQNTWVFKLNLLYSRNYSYYFVQNLAAFGNWMFHSSFMKSKFYSSTYT
jgi:hypothetical protein